MGEYTILSSEPYWEWERLKAVSPTVKWKRFEAARSVQPHLLERACVTAADFNVEFKQGIEEQNIRWMYAVVEWF